MIQIIDNINSYIWLGVIALLVGCALYFTFRSHFVQFGNLRDMLRIMSGRDTHEERKIGSFHAFAVSLSSRVGTGNLAGVASAIFVGGPGAVFWMWIMALLGAATAFVEATLAQLYKRRGKDSFYGGPAYYITHGLHCKWMALLFAVLIIFTFGMANQIVQSNTLITSISDTLHWNKLILAAFFCAITIFIIFGGITRISRFAAFCVPVMAIGYLVIAIVIMVMNYQAVPDMIMLILNSAFGTEQAVGGMVGAAVMQGVKRGLFSNEAGEGSAPNAAAIAETSHPVKQGLLQALGVFTDTLVICTCTAIIILLSGLWDSGADGIILTANALEKEIGVMGRYFITLAILLFAYSTIIANYFYGETNIRYIFKGRKERYAIFTFRIITGAVIIVGGIVTLQQAWSIVDIAMALMTTVNLIAIILLSKYVWRLLDNYRVQKLLGEEPQFHREDMPDIADDLDCWENVEQDVTGLHEGVLKTHQFFDGTE